MDKNAENDFIFFTDLSFAYGLIDRTIYIERMVVLYEMMDLPPGIIKDIVPEYGYNYYLNLIENDRKDERNERDERIVENKFGVFIEKTEPNGDILSLYKTNNSGKYCKWLFHDNDVDQNPSIPHGHGIQKTKLRLDPYRRTIYEKQNSLNTIGLEQKKFIKKLWNDDIFRDYVLKAIKNFITSGRVGQNYNWYGIRGIRDPFRIPRKRK